MHGDPGKNVAPEERWQQGVEFYFQGTILVLLFSSSRAFLTLSSSLVSIPIHTATPPPAPRVSSYGSDER